MPAWFLAWSGISGGASTFCHVQLLSAACLSGHSLLARLFEDALQTGAPPHQIEVIGYVVMPEHVHLLLSEPAQRLLAAGLQALKLSVVRRARQRPFWQARYYDFNVFTEVKRIEKLYYMHWNPVKRGLVDKPEDWRWSSCRYYQTGEQGRVKIECSWRDQPKPDVEKRTGAPGSHQRTWDDNDFFPLLFPGQVTKLFSSVGRSKSIGGASPIFFVPRTLGCSCRGWWRRRTPCELSFNESRTRQVLSDAA